MDNAAELAWHKSTASESGGCVEVALLGESVFVRDTKDRLGGTLQFTASEWSALLARIRGGDFELS